MLRLDRFHLSLALLAALGLAMAGCANIAGISGNYEQAEDATVVADGNVVALPDGGPADANSDATTDAATVSGTDAAVYDGGAAAFDAGDGALPPPESDSGGDAADATADALDGGDPCSADAGPGALGLLGCPCSSPGEFVCNGHAQKLQLICSGGNWSSNGVCGAGALCDSRTGPGQGTCLPIDPLCATVSPGADVCPADASSVVQCGPDLVSTTVVAECTNQTCVSGACTGVCAPGQTTPVACGNCGIDTQACGVSGSFETSGTCVNQGRCAIGCSAAAECMVCKPDAGYCAGSSFEQCAPDGLSETSVACGGACASNLGCVACIPGTATCDSNGNLSICEADGGAVVQACGARYRCDEADQKCIPSSVAMSVGAGLYVTNCAVVQEAGVYCWGATGGWTHTASPIAGTANAIKVAMGMSDGCAILALGDGGTSLSCWPNASSAATDLGGWNDVVDVSFGTAWRQSPTDFACALHAAGTVSCWGQGAEGQLGNDAGTTSTTPVTVAGITNAVQIAVARDLQGSAACARLSGGTVSCWGGGAKTPVDIGVTGATNLVLGGGGTVIVIEGTGSTSTAVYLHYNYSGLTGTFSAPAAYMTIPNVAQLAADSTLYVVHTDGGVDTAPLGTGAPGALSPVLPADAGVVELWTRLGGNGSGDGCYRTGTGTVFCWGDDADGEWGDGFSWNVPVPLQLPTIVGATLVTPIGGWGAAAAVLSSGQVYEWSSPTEGAAYSWGGAAVSMTPAAVTGAYGTNARFVNTYGGVGSLVVQQTGVVEAYYYGTVSPYTAGWSASLGLNSLGITDWAAVTATGNYDMGWSPSTGVVVYAETAGVSAGMFGTDAGSYDAGVHVVVPGTQNVVGVAMPNAITGGSHACAWNADGGTLCWGAGDGFTSTPAPLSFAGAAPRVVYASVATDTCIVDDQGEVYCGGLSNSYGQLGYTGAANTLLTKVAGIGVPAVGVAVQNTYACAWLRDTTAVCWGLNSSGQLGDGTSTTRPTPAPVMGITNVASMSVGGATTCALHRDGRASCWGADEYGTTGTINAPNIVGITSARNTVGFGP